MIGSDGLRGISIHGPRPHIVDTGPDSLGDGQVACQSLLMTPEHGTTQPEQRQHPDQPQLLEGDSAAPLGNASPAPVTLRTTPGIGPLAARHQKQQNLNDEERDRKGQYEGVLELVTLRQNVEVGEPAFIEGPGLNRCPGIVGGPGCSLFDPAADAIDFVRRQRGRVFRHAKGSVVRRDMTINLIGLQRAPQDWAARMAAGHGPLRRIEPQAAALPIWSMALQAVRGQNRLNVADELDRSR